MSSNEGHSLSHLCQSRKHPTVFLFYFFFFFFGVCPSHFPPSYLHFRNVFVHILKNKKNKKNTKKMRHLLWWLCLHRVANLANNLDWCLMGGWFY